MPGFNQTGPEGQGSMTGRRMGRCTNYGRNLKKQKTLLLTNKMTIHLKIYQEEVLALA